MKRREMEHYHSSSRHHRSNNPQRFSHHSSDSQTKERLIYPNRFLDIRKKSNRKQRDSRHEYFYSDMPRKRGSSTKENVYYSQARGSSGSRNRSRFSRHPKGDDLSPRGSRM